MIRPMADHLIYDIAADAASRDPIGEFACANYSSGCLPLTPQHQRET